MMTRFPLIGPGMELVGFQLHGLFMLAALVGLIFLIIYAVKHLSRDHMKSLIIWLLAVGLVGALFTTPFARGSFRQAIGLGGCGQRYGIEKDLRGGENGEEGGSPVIGEEDDRGEVPNP
jgi:hypothetical protein